MFLPKKRLWGCRENKKVDSWRNPLMSAFFLMGEATAEGRLYNRSPRLACLPGVGCRRRESTAEERLYKLFAR